MTELVKYVYFPTGQETGMKKDTPEIIYCFDLFIDGKRTYIKASTNKEAALRSHGKFFLTNRTVPYTEALWEACREYVLKVKALDKEYELLFKNRKKYKDEGWK